MLSRCSSGLILMGIIVTFFAACDAETAPQEVVIPSYTIRMTADGKVDSGQGLLSADELKRLEEALEDAISVGDATVQQLEREIAQLEEQSTAKLRQINRLVEDIESREDELEQQHSNNSFLCLFFPKPQICVFAEVISNDSRMKAYKQELEEAQTRQTQIRAQVRRYEEQKAELVAKLVPVRETKDQLLAMLRSGVESEPTPEVLVNRPEMSDLYLRVESLQQVLEMVDIEIDILTEIRDLAASTFQQVSKALRELIGLAGAVDKLVQESRQQFLDLVEALLSPNPGAFVEDWLDDVVADKTAEFIEFLGFPVQELVQHLLDNTDPLAPVDLGELREQLVAKFLSKLEQDFVQGSNLEVASIKDHKVTQSKIVIDENFMAKRIEFAVDVEHESPGDLEVWFGKGDLTSLSDLTRLRRAIGNVQDGPVKTYSIELPDPIEAKGEWTIYVADLIISNEGQFLGWSILFR